MLEKLEKIDPDVEVILISGDNLAHSFSAKYGQEDHYELVKETLEYVFVELIAEHFPDAIVLPTMGNNDIKYHYLAPAQDDEAQDFYTFFADILFDKIPGNKKLNSEQIKEHFLYRGYYRHDYDFKTYRDGFYLSFLSLNTLYYAEKSPKQEPEIMTQQFDWLEEQLANAEDDRKFVIFDHIFPGEYFYMADEHQWDEASTVRFKEIIYKYSDHIAILLGAHTHFLELRIDTPTTDSSSKFLKLEKEYPEEPKLAMLITPSVSPSFKNNPGMTTFIIENNVVKDIKCTFLELYNEPTKAEEAVFNTLDFAQELRIDTFTPKKVQAFLKTLEESRLLFLRYLGQKVGYRGLSSWWGFYLHYEIGMVGLISTEIFFCTSTYLLKDDVHKCKGY